MVATFLHVVQAFKETDDGVIAVEPRKFPTAGLAREAAPILSHTHSGVIAWSRRADPDAGQYGEPEEIIRYGFIPGVLRRGRRGRLSLSAIPPQKHWPVKTPRGGLVKARTPKRLARILLRKRQRKTSG